MVIDFLEKMIGKTDDEKYQKEEAIHKIIFPLRNTSDDISYKDHNLWLIDERLVYHNYLASDLPFNKQIKSPVTVESGDRPDILIYKGHFALAQGDSPFSSVTIIEFKRPERTSYSEAENPITQVLNYVDQIKKGKAKNRHGSTITISTNTQFYCYIIATLNESLKQKATNYSYTEHPDGNGYFGYNRHYNAYIEIIPFDKLISDAKKRNRAFFDKLNLSPL